MSTVRSANRELARVTVKSRDELQVLPQARAHSPGTGIANGTTVQKH